MFLIYAYIMLEIYKLDYWANILQCDFSDMDAPLKNISCDLTFQSTQNMFWSWWYTIFIAMYSSVAIIHLIGILLLCKAKHSLPNQRLLTMNLAIAEMVTCLITAVFYAVLPSYDQIEYKVVLLFLAIAFVEVRLTMLHIIFDRFLEIYTNNRYPVIMTHRNIAMLVGAHPSGHINVASSFEKVTS